MREDTLPYFGPRHRAAADAAKSLAEAADTDKLVNMLRMYADDIENDYGRAHAPQWMREAAKRIEALTKSTDK
jgi:predicted ArsR family transcriptional regulator